MTSLFLNLTGQDQSYWDQVSREKTLMHDKYIEGKADGEAKGRHEEKYIIAKNLLQNGANVELVVNSTGLTRVEVEAIKRELENS